MDLWVTAQSQLPQDWGDGSAGWGDDCILHKCGKDLSITLSSQTTKWAWPCMPVILVLYVSERRVAWGLGATSLILSSVILSVTRKQGREWRMPGIVFWCPQECPCVCPCMRAYMHTYVHKAHTQQLPHAYCPTDILQIVVTFNLKHKLWTLRV